MATMTPEAFQDATGTDDPTLDRLRVYADLLIRWQARINLVGPDTLPDLWRRHFLDSQQLVALLPPGARRLADLGSGAGFPGLVLAILGAPDPQLVESDARKVAFLREVARATATRITLHTDRIERLAPLNADIVTARALASLAKLLPYAERHLAPGGLCLFLKGKTAEHELTEARKDWMMTCRRIRSLSDPSGLILHLEEVRRGRA
jgi:16S rRNA (guanine527-N7)-methyltransferase